MIYGYYKNQAGDIVAKAVLPAPPKNTRKGFTFVETTAAQLELIEVATQPLSEAAQAEKKINVELRKIAVKNLKIRGEIDSKYEVDDGGSLRKNI